MLERKRAAKTYSVVPGEEDVELGETGHVEEQETGVVGTNVTEELDNWDENADDWEEDEVHDAATESAEANGNVQKEARD